MSHIYIHDAQGRKYRQPVTVVEPKADGVPALVVPHMVSTNASDAASGSSTGGLSTTVTLTALGTGYLKQADGTDPTFPLIRGGRYAWIVSAPSPLTSGVIAPKLGGITGMFFPSANDDSATPLTYNFAKATLTSFGFEFVALADTFSLATAGFTKDTAIEFCLVRILD